MARPRQAHRSRAARPSKRLARICAGYTLAEPRSFPAASTPSLLLFLRRQGSPCSKRRSRQPGAAVKQVSASDKFMRTTESGLDFAFLDDLESRRRRLQRSDLHMPRTLRNARPRRLWQGRSPETRERAVPRRANRRRNRESPRRELVGASPCARPLVYAVRRIVGRRLSNILMTPVLGAPHDARAQRCLPFDAATIPAPAPWNIPYAVNAGALSSRATGLAPPMTQREAPRFGDVGREQMVPKATSIGTTCGRVRHKNQRKLPSMGSVIKGGVNGRLSRSEERIPRSPSATSHDDSVEASLKRRSLGSEVTPLMPTIGFQRLHNPGVLSMLAQGRAGCQTEPPGTRRRSALGLGLCVIHCFNSFSSCSPVPPHRLQIRGQHCP